MTLKVVRTSSARSADRVKKLPKNPLNFKKPAFKKVNILMQLPLKYNYGNFLGKFDSFKITQNEDFTSN